MNDPQRTQNLERAVLFAIQYIEHPPGLIFSQRDRTAVLEQLHGALNGTHRFEERDLIPRLGQKGQGDG